MSDKPRFIRLDSAGKKISKPDAPFVAVEDSGTGLIWSVAETKPMSWKQAIAHAKKLKLCGLKGWQLPTCDQLLTLVDRTRINPATDIGVFPDCKGGWYWTSTPYAGSPGEYGWGVSFGNGYAYWAHQGFEGLVRAVRPRQ